MEQAREISKCYKVIVATRKDEIVPIEASTMVGVATEVCAQEKKRKAASWRGAVGILNKQEIR